MQLHSAAAAAGYRLVALETWRRPTPKRCCWRAAASADRSGSRPRQQTAGRGRRGNAWNSPPGNLYATLLLHDPAPAEHAPELSFVAALALHDAVGECAPALRRELKFKWPNDVLAGGAKIAGILIESERARRKTDAS